MLTPNIARDLIHRIPTCQMNLLGKISWKCSDSSDHAHTMFGSRNIKDGKLVPNSDDNCKVSLKTMLMDENIFQEALTLTDWSCYDSTYQTTTIYYEETCKQCNNDKSRLTAL